MLKRMQTRLIEAIDRSPGAGFNVLRRLMIRTVGRMGRYVFADPYAEGSWYGNDTIWRTVLDLNRLIIYANREGEMADLPQRRCFTIVDGIFAGEREGPMQPGARACGLLIAGGNPLSVGAVVATLVGFDYRKIPMIAGAFDAHDWPLVALRPEEVCTITQDEECAHLKIGDPCNRYLLQPPSGWTGFIESFDSSPAIPIAATEKNR